jgi:class 3 adenylate cyclase/DNA-binding winged helix-turn-helix (wHTH) protein/tetratricopeptide (TPR) repeat protein
VQGETLFRDTEPVALSKRAVALLRVLIERAGAPVSKDTLIDAAWPGLAIEESNLTVQIAALRRALGEVPGGEGWIVTLSRRGYRFVGPVVTKSEAQGTAAPMADPAPKLSPATAPALPDKPSLRCSKCGHDNAIEAKFCEECATQLAPICASCGTQLSPTAKFCPACAHPTSAPQSRFVSPEAYTPRHLAEKILTSKTALEGERKQLTALFADVEGYMELLADRDPEDARGLLDPVLERMMDAVHHYEGTVNEVSGDGIMALFGAPIAHEDHAVRACYAALRMQEAVKRYAVEVQRSEGLLVQIRVGISSGEVVVRSIGSDLRMDYTAVGQTTHLAARMEQLAAPGGIQVTAETLRLAEGFVEVNPLGRVPIKGLAEPVEVFELMGAGAARTRLEAAARRGLTRFVGRSAELSLLRDGLDCANEGRGQVVAVVGEPGVGKSRLFWEITHSHHVDGWRVLKTGSVSYGKVTSYLPVIDLLKGYFKIDDRDELHEIRKKVTGELLRLDESLESTVLPVLGLLDVPVEDSPWTAFDPEQRRRRTLDAVRQLLLREAREQPLLLIFEDLHWLDGETQSLLDGLVESLPASRVLLLVNYRPEYSHGWSSKTYYRQLRIDPLPSDSADELLNALLGLDPALAPLKQLLVERAEANPLFLEESVRALAETGALAGEQGAYHLNRSIEQLKIPGTVQAILATRIDRLAPEAKWLLQVAAVIGKDVSLPLLLDIADVPEHEVRAGLTRLQAAEFLYEVGLFPDLKYTFKHALTQEVAYQGLLQHRQRALHARITEAIERLSSERVSEQAELLAHHALRGELWQKAVVYLRQAGLRAMARGANREAIVHLEQALSALRRLPETREGTELTIDIRLDLRNALLAPGDWARMGDHLREAEMLARSLGDQHRLGRIATFMVTQCLATGEYDRAVGLGAEALTIARALGDRSVHVVATTFLGLAHLVRGDFSDATTLLMGNVAVEGDPSTERSGAAAIRSALSESYLAEVLSELGRFDEAIKHAEAAVRIAEAADHAFTLYFGLFALGLVHLRVGDLPHAIQVLKRGLDLCRTWQHVARTPLFAAALGAAYALAGRADDALPLVAIAVEEFNRHQVHNRPAFILLCAGLTSLSAGRIAEAASYAGEALALTRRLGARGSEARALCLAGDVASKGGGEGAEGNYRQGLAVATRCGMRPLVAHCHIGLGKLHRQMGNWAQAQEHLTIATAIYSEMHMTYWLEQAVAELRQLG